MVDFSMQFPAGFLWGTATAAHQVEGDNTRNNWSAWETAGHIYQRQQSGPACAWWDGRYLEDFDRAADLHNNALRLSIEWSRIQPDRTHIDGKALDRYAEIIAALRARHLEPLVTLHHFTNPLWLEDRGGWTNPEMVDRFERFVRVIAEELGDQVTMWCTINEPLVYATLSYLQGKFPPGHRNMRETTKVIEHLLRAHAAAYHVIKDLRPNAQVGFAKHQISLKTTFPKPINGLALRTMRHFFNEAFIEAITTGVLRLPSHKVAVPDARDTLDWIGLNYYYRFISRFNLLAIKQLFLEQGKPHDGIPGPGDVGEIWPEGLFEQIRWLYETTGKPIYITENGVADADDSLRPLHLIRSLRSVWQAINHNYPVKGYFFWSLVDNFEWAEGYDPRFRFGLYGCDHETQVRTKKASADLYGEICAASAITSDTARRFIPDQFDALFPGIPVQQTVKLPPKS